MENEKTPKKELPLATEVIRTLKKVIFGLIILILFIVGGFVWYISLPVEYVDSNVTQNSDNASTNNYVGGDYSGSDTNN